MKHNIIFALLMTCSWSLMAAPAMDTAAQPVKPAIATGGSAGDTGGGITPFGGVAIVGGGIISTVLIVTKVANPGPKTKRNAVGLGSGPSATHH